MGRSASRSRDGAASNGKDKGGDGKRDVALGIFVDFMVVSWSFYGVLWLFYGVLWCFMIVLWSLFGVFWCFMVFYWGFNGD